MPRRPSLIKTSESPELRITSISATEKTPQRERSDVSKQPGQERRGQLIASGLVFGLQSLGKTKPRLAVAIVSCALFAALLVRVSHVTHDQSLSLATPPAEATLMK